MFNSFPVRSGDAPLLWLELFDHGVQRSLDSCSVREIDDALSAFDVLVSQARKLDEVCRQRPTTRV